MGCGKQLVLQITEYTDYHTASPVAYHCWGLVVKILQRMLPLDLESRRMSLNAGRIMMEPDGPFAPSGSTSWRAQVNPIPAIGAVVASYSNKVHSKPQWQRFLPRGHT